MFCILLFFFVSGRKTRKKKHIKFNQFMPFQAVHGCPKTFLLIKWRLEQLVVYIPSTCHEIGLSMNNSYQPPESGHNLDILASDPWRGHMSCPFPRVVPHDQVATSVYRRVGLGGPISLLIITIMIYPYYHRPRVHVHCIQLLFIGKCKYMIVNWADWNGWHSMSS